VYPIPTDFNEINIFTSDTFKRLHAKEKTRRKRYAASREFTCERDELHCKPSVLLTLDEAGTSQVSDQVTGN